MIDVIRFKVKTHLFVQAQLLILPKKVSLAIRDICELTLEGFELIALKLPEYDTEDLGKIKHANLSRRS